MTTKLLIGVITVYTAAAFGGQPLYCDTWDTDLHYDEVTPPWVALDVSLYQSGEVRCGDLLHLRGAGWEMNVLALDSGYFDEFYVWFAGLGRRIVADMPGHLAPFDALSAVVTIWNVSAMVRELGEEIDD